MTTTPEAGTPPLGTSIVRPFADGDYKFYLTYDAVTGWERAHDRSLFATVRAAVDGVWRATDVREIIRLALIGGGTEPTKALTLVKDYVEARPLTENVDLFIEILSAMFFGVGGPDAKK